MLTIDDIQSKLDDIYDDFAANVTHIAGRPDLHLAIDLGYHSPISFRFDNKLIKKGYPEILIIGDTRCLGGETLIDDPVAKVSLPVCEIKEDFHVTAWDGEKLVTARAEKPFKKDVDKLYTVTLSTGESFVCSKSHVVLTPSGWRALGQLQVGCAVFHPQSIEGTSPSVRASDAQHYCQTVAGYQSGCPACSRSHDAQPLLEGDTFQDAPPSQGDVPLHTSDGVCAHMDAKEHGLECSHQHQDCGHLSKKGAPLPLGSHTGTQSHASLELCVSGGDQDRASLRSRAVCVPPSPIPEVAELDNQFYSNVPCDAPFSVILSIVYKRDDVKWDFTVPEYHNYLCGGIIHHNTGKTQAATALQAHYGCGSIAQAEAMSYAGLVGGCQKMFDTKWDVTWGKLPQNNRRLVIIDETSGMDEIILGRLSDVRSSGVATLEKIVSQKTEAKTRIIWLSNPRGRDTVSHFSSGINVIETLCKQPEDIARWDMAIIVAKEDVSIDALHAARKHRVPHKYTSKLCHALVLWAWTREVDEIIISEETEEACYAVTKKMCKKYCGDFTLISDAELPVKLIRLATSLAARLFSTPDGVKLIVLPVHVEYIFHYLQRIYDTPAFGFDFWSENRMAGQQIIDKEEVSQFILRLKKAGASKFLAMDKLKLKDIEEFLGISSDEARVMLSMLLNNNAMHRYWGDYYQKSPEFNRMLRAATKLAIMRPEVPAGDAL